MSIKNKVILIVMLAGSIYICSDYAIFRIFVFPNFIKLEQIEARKDIARVVAAIDREIHYLDQFTTDWAYWDDAYYFINDRNNDFLTSNLTPDSVFTENNLNLIYFMDLEGNVTWGRTYGLGADSALEAHLWDNYVQISALVPDKDVLLSNSGLLSIGSDVLIISFAPILKSNLEGPANGTLVMGRMLDEDYTRTLAEQTKLDLVLWNIADPAIPIPDRETLLTIQENSKDNISIKQVSDSFLKCHTVLHDLKGKPAVLARIFIPRDIAEQGESALFYTTLSIFVAGIIFVILLLFLLHINVSKPISHLTENITQINSERNFFLSSNVNRKDEIGALAQEFNSLIEKLDLEITDHKESIKELETALSEIQTLRGLLPICSHCNKIRDDSGVWNNIEAYISQRSEAEFSHGICPECIREHYIKDFQ